MSDLAIGACWLRLKQVCLRNSSPSLHRSSLFKGAAGVLDVTLQPVSAKSPKACPRRPHGPRHPSSQHRRCLAKATSSRLQLSYILPMHVDGERQPYEDSMHELCSSGRHRDISFALATLKPNDFQAIRHPLAFEAYRPIWSRLLRLGKCAAEPFICWDTGIRPASHPPARSSHPLDLPD